jgi:hypothetical protein
VNSYYKNPENKNENIDIVKEKSKTDGKILLSQNNSNNNNPTNNN